MRRRSHALLVAVFSASAALAAVGCSGGDDTSSGSGADTTATQISDTVTLDGVRIDVRRDPG